MCRTAGAQTSRRKPCDVDHCRPRSSLLLALWVRRSGNSIARGKRLSLSDLSVCLQPFAAHDVASIALAPENERRRSTIRVGQAVSGFCTYALIRTGCCTRRVVRVSSTVNSCCPGQGTRVKGPLTMYMRSSVSSVQVDEDANLDNCVLCGLGGNLICCDGCPAAVHLRCIGETAKSIPDGEWLCAECRMGSRGEHCMTCCTTT